MHIRNLLIESQTEHGKGVYQQLPIDITTAEGLDAAVAYINKHCPTALAHNLRSDTLLWRGGGTNRGNAFVQDTLSSVRRAAHTSNFVNSLTGVLPSWKTKGIPDRAKGVSCTTDSGVAYGYGRHLYLAFPTENTTIVLSQADDFWNSLPNANALGFSVNNINNELAELYKMLYVYTDNLENHNPKTVTTEATLKLIETIDIITSFTGADTKQEKEQMTDIQEMMIKKSTLYNEFLNSSFDTFYKFMDHLLDPVDFELGKGSQLPSLMNNASHDEEVFLSGHILFLEESAWEAIKAHVNS